jgi:hypothetical protein
VPSELETRVEAALVALPGPSSGAEARARAAALRALPRTRGRSGWRRPLLAAAAAVVVLGAGAAALAQTGTLHVRVGAAHEGAATAARLELPPSAHGIALVAGGRLWLTTRAGTRIEGLPVTAAELSPHALYVAAGIGRALVVMAPDGRRAWALRTGGRVTAISWSPDGLRIAYVVRAAGRTELRWVEGDGDHAVVLEAGVRPVRPAWRADSLALAYVGAGGRAVVDDLARGTHRIVDTGRCAGAIRLLAYGPTGSALALAGRSSVYLDGGVAGPARCVELSAGRVGGLAWARGSAHVAVGGDVVRVAISGGDLSLHAVHGPVGPGPIAAAPDGSLVLGTRGAVVGLTGGRTLLTLPDRPALSSLVVR